MNFLSLRVVIRATPAAYNCNEPKSERSPDYGLVQTPPELRTRVRIRAITFIPAARYACR
jgi:hypothetical protein